MERLLNEQTVDQIRKVFEELKEPVQILFFGSQQDCEYCTETRQLLEEIVELDDRLGLSVYDVQTNAEVAAKFNMDKAPGIVVAAKDGDQISNFGIQFSGLPSGHEFSTLINDILLVSGRDSGLSEPVRDFLKHLEKPVHLQVFVTPT